MTVIDIGNQGYPNIGHICWGDGCSTKAISTPVDPDDSLGLCDRCRLDIIGSSTKGFLERV